MGDETKTSRAGRLKSAAWAVCAALAWAVGARAEVLTVATYNVENYLLADRMVEGVFREAYPKPEAAKAALRRVIVAMNADVLALQEMGAPAFLEELRRDLAREGAEYAHAALLEAADADRHVAVLSKRPFKSVGRHTDLTFSYFGKTEPVKRGLLEVRLETEAGEVTLFVVHLKSRFTDRDDDFESLKRRSGEATAVRERVLKIFPDPAAARFAILGDCNDTIGSRPLRALLQKGKTKIAEAVPAADSAGEVWTHFYKKEGVYSRVDYVLVSPGLRPAVEGGAGRIWDGPDVAAASDHRPVVVRWVLGAEGKAEGLKN